MLMDKKISTAKQTYPSTLRLATDCSYARRLHGQLGSYQTILEG